MLRRKNNRRNRKGAVVVLAALFMVSMLGIVAFCVDIGYLANASAELQRAADASALAGAYQLINFSAPGQNFSQDSHIANARTSAVQYAGLNKVCNASPTVSPNTANAVSGDILIGSIATPTIPGTPMTFGNSNQFNAVLVNVSRSSGENGEVPMFFGAIFARNSVAASKQSTAAVVINFSGFQMPADGSNLDILPFAFDQQTWNSMMQGSGQDAFTWDPTTNSVKAGGDGVPEGNLYPQGNGSPGNRGTVDIGSPSNSTADINRQILYGADASDLSYLGGKLALNSDGVLLLNGDTGISAGVKSNLDAIIGQPKIVPIFSTVNGPGNNAEYTIVEFVCVRVLQVQLTGKSSSKSVIIQPASMIAKGGISSTSSTQTSAGIYSLPFLIR
ncbi:MAG TPA: pilus assembly protein TadG-related protein [Pirellulales bacterium]|jgi:Flp pilus assembly protein TadG